MHVDKKDFITILPYLTVRQLQSSQDTQAQSAHRISAPSCLLTLNVLYLSASDQIFLVLVKINSCYIVQLDVSIYCAKTRLRTVV